MNYGNAAAGGFFVATGGTLATVGGAHVGMGAVLAGIVCAVLGSALVYRFGTRRNRIGAADQLDAR